MFLYFFPPKYVSKRLQNQVSGKQPLTFVLHFFLLLFSNLLRNQKIKHTFEQQIIYLAAQKPHFRQK